MAVDQMSPWTLRILKLLADGEWHTRDELVDVGTAAIPPGVAYRRGEADRMRGRPNGPGPRTRGSRDDSIRRGARMIVARTLYELRRNGHAEADGEWRHRLVEVIGDV